MLRFLDLSGTLPTRVWLHGFPLASSAYFPTFAAHPDLVDHRNLLPDFLGFGYSDRPDAFTYTMQAHADTIAQLLDVLNLKGSDVIGQSWGGSIAILLAESRPDLVGQLVLIDAYVDSHGGGPLTEAIAEQSEDEYITAGHSQLILGTRERALVSGSETTAAFLATLEAASPQAVHRSARSLYEGASPSLRKRLGGLSIPRSYIVGAIEERPDVDALGAEGVHVAKVRDAGRFMFAEQPQAFVQAIRSCLERSC